MSARRNTGRRAGIVVAIIVGGVVALNLLAQGLDRAVGGGQPGGADGSSYATKGSGLAAYATLLHRYGHDVRAQRGAIADNPPDPASTLFVIDPGELTREDSDAVVQFVSEGGRLVIGGPTPFYLRNLRDRPPTWSPDGQTRWVTQYGTVREIAAAGQGAWSAPGSGRAVVGDAASALLTSDRVENGEMLFLADPSPLENDLLAEADNAAFGLALAADRPVVFAEGVHGFGAQRGVRAIPGPWKVALLLLGIAGLAFVWSRARRFGPPDHRSRELPPARAEYVRSLSATLERARDPAHAFVNTQQYARDRLAARAALGPQPDAEQLAQAARAIGCREDEIAAMLGPIGDDTQVLALGRATARVTGSDGRTE